MHARRLYNRFMVYVARTGRRLGPCMSNIIIIVSNLAPCFMLHWGCMVKDKGFTTLKAAYTSQDIELEASNTQMITHDYCYSSMHRWLGTVHVCIRFRQYMHSLIHQCTYDCTMKAKKPCTVLVTQFAGIYLNHPINYTQITLYTIVDKVCIKVHKVYRSSLNCSTKQREVQW